MESRQILKNLHAVLVYAKERFNNEFFSQEVVLDERAIPTFTKSPGVFVIILT